MYKRQSSRGGEVVDTADLTQQEREAKACIAVLPCLELLQTLASAAAPSKDAITLFWQGIRYDFVLLMLMKAQPIEEVLGMLELVRGYAALAEGGKTMPLRILMHDPSPRISKQAYSEAAATLTANILSDPHARSLEFGANSVLNFNLQTAVKTGTSTDYRDAWAVGFNDRYVVGIWMGNLDHKVTDGVTGGTGPALALRSIFNELNRGRVTQKLKISPQLALHDVCIEDSRHAERCYMLSEWFMPHTAPDAEDIAAAAAQGKPSFGIAQPTEGLHMAIDPRVPMDMQEFAFRLSGLRDGQSVEWVLNGESLGAASSDASRLWMLKRGRHKLQARISENGHDIFTTPPVSYVVK